MDQQLLDEIARDKWTAFRNISRQTSRMSDIEPWVIVVSGIVGGALIFLSGAILALWFIPDKAPRSEPQSIQLTPGTTVTLTGPASIVLPAGTILSVSQGNTQVRTP